MKKELNHIDEIFKNSLENFEGNVDPSVWANVSQSIGNTAGATSVGGAATSGVSKSILFYAAASIVATATVIGSVYLLNNNKNEQKTIEQTTITSPVSEENTEIRAVLENKDENVVVEETNTVMISEETKASLLESNQIINNESVERKTIGESVNSASQSEVEVVVNKNSVETKTTIAKPETKENSTQPTAQKTEVKELNVSIRSNVKKGKAPLDVEFGVSGEGVSYLWDFGDNTTVSSEEAPYHTYKKPGTYKVTLTAIDEKANAKVSYQIIEVEKNKVSQIDEIQNVFSPNGDGINDVIKVDGENITKFHAAVMDSKGNLIYEWDSIDGFWDGRDNNNNILPKGTYYLVVTAKGEDGEQHIAKKSIQLY